MSKLKQIIGYEKLDNVLTGLVLGFIAIGGIYYFQSLYYRIETLGDYGVSFQIPFLKRSLLGALFIFLIFNYFDKTFAMKGVLLSVIIVGVYLVYKLFFSL